MRKRLALLVVAVVLAAGAIAARLYQLQIVAGPELAQRARRQQERRIEVPGRRGDVLDRRGRKLATSVAAFSLYAHPPRFVDETERRRAARSVARVLGLRTEAVERKLRTSRPFVWLGRRLDEETIRALAGEDGDPDEARLDLSGVGPLGVEPEPKRVYPNGRLAGHVVGCANVDQVGIEGVELQFDDLLRSEPSVAVGWRDGRGGGGAVREPARGSTAQALVLTIDAVLQYVVERELDRAMAETGARSASVVLLEPESGQVLALANRPAADPNRYGAASEAERRNRAVVDVYEPGSTFKIVTASAALDASAVRPDQRFDCEDGAARMAGTWIHDHHPYGVISMREIVLHSSNIGMAKVCRPLGPGGLYRRIRHFGFGGRTGIELPGERRGLLRPVSDWSALSPVSIAFGQEIAVTALQMASAVATVANRGVRTPPRVVSGVRDAGGQFRPFPPAAAEQVISADTAETLTDILEDVVRRGTGTLATVPGYRVAGKTGTAQKVVAGHRGYSPTDYVASFGGFAPVSSPAIAALVVLDTPRGDRHEGGQIAAPVFARIMEQALSYLRVEPDAAPPVRVGAPRSRPLQASGVRLSPTPRDRIPDVLGLAARDAVSALAGRGCRVRIEGSGRVTSQSPAPGAPAETGQQCVIRLSSAAPAPNRRGSG